jgi:hypothetical protein
MARIGPCGSRLDFDTAWETSRRPSLRNSCCQDARRSCSSFLEWLRSSSESAAIKAESIDEAVAVIVAAMLKLPPEERVSFLSRALVVYSESAWDQIVLFGEPLILIPCIDGDSSFALARGTPHRIIVPLGTDGAESTGTIIVPRPSVDEAAKALTAAGIGELRAGEFAVLARRSLKAFRRKLAQRPEIRRPPWALPSEASALKPVLLTGAWNHLTPDKQTGYMTATEFQIASALQPVHAGGVHI